MAEVKWIKIPSNFFEYEVIKSLDDSDVLLYIHILCECYKKGRKGIFKISNIELTDEVLNIQFRFDNIDERLRTLEEHGLIVRKERQLQAIKFWIDKRNRNSPEYRSWRTEVFKRDNYECQSCGTRKGLQAHHVKQWKDNIKERYEVSNGVTLCRACHLKAHGGRWK